MCFFNPSTVKQIWQVIVQHFDVEEIKEMNWRDIFLGLPGNSVRNKFVNSMLIMLKYIVFRSRKEGVIPSVIKIRNTILEYIEEEKKSGRNGAR